MAGKRSYIDGILKATGSSSYFTQDLEDGDDDTHQPPAGAGDKSVPKPSASPAQKAAAAKPTTHTTPTAGTMSFQQYIVLLNEGVPSGDRFGWMKKANGGQDTALLARLAADIKIAYPQGSSSARTSEDKRIAVMEFINTVVPEPDRPYLRTTLEKIEDKDLDDTLSELKARYEA
jgi:hypothetical protein